MTQDEFTKAIKTQTSDAATFGVRSCLERPPGRRPSERDRELSRWYKDLVASDQTLVMAVAQEAAELAIFSFLCVLDGVSAIENGPEKGKLKLTYEKDGSVVTLNNAEKDFLHDSYNDLCQNHSLAAPQRSENRLYEVGSAEHLRQGQTQSDAMDLHSVSSRDNREASSEAPSIALPKNEHRKL